jgi:hypothetical protein
MVLVEQGRLLRDGHRQTAFREGDMRRPRTICPRSKAGEGMARLQSRASFHPLSHRWRILGLAHQARTAPAAQPCHGYDHQPRNRIPLRIVYVIYQYVDRKEEEKQRSVGELLIEDVHSLIRESGFPEEVATSIASRLQARWQGTRPHLFGPTEATAQPDRLLDDNSLPLPDKAPALWATDRLPKENPAEFTRRVYGEWIGKGFSRADMLHLDKPLYKALANWLSRQGNELPFDLPTKKEVNNRWIDRVRDASTNEHAEALQTPRTVGRLAAAMQRRNLTIERSGRKDTDETPETSR